MILDESAVNAKVHEQLPLVLVSLTWSILAVVIACRKGFFKPFVSAKYSPVSGQDVLIGFAIFIIIQVVVMPALIVTGTYLFTGKELDFESLSKTAKSWVDLSFLLGGYLALALFFLFSLSKDKQRAIFGEKNDVWYEDFLFGASTWLIIFPLVLLWSTFIDILIIIFLHRSPLEQAAVEQFRLSLDNPLLLVCMSLSIFGLVPIVEEFLFRGLLQSWLKTRFQSARFGIVVSALVFALFHFSTSQGITNIQLLTSLFMLGCFLGYLYEKQRSLWASIGLHSIFNAISVLLVINE